MLRKVNLVLFFLKAGDFRLIQSGIKYQLFLLPAQWPHTGPSTSLSLTPHTVTWPERAERAVRSAWHVAGTVEAPVSLLFYLQIVCVTPGPLSDPVRQTMLARSSSFCTQGNQFRHINKWPNTRSDSQDAEDLGGHPESSECKCGVLIKVEWHENILCDHSLWMTWLFPQRVLLDLC